MVVSEEQAKSLWCPFSRVGLGGAQITANRHMSDDAAMSGSHCLGPGCMAWAWWNDPPDKTKRMGFCGLAHNRTGLP